MASAQLNTFLRRLRQTLHPATESASDAQLLQRFVHERDEQAFELLVWRHGLMVLNVCDAETLAVLRLNGHKELHRKLKNASPQTQPLLDAIFSAEAVKDMTEECFAANLLMGPARPGDSWTKTRRPNASSPFRHQTTCKFTYVGKVDKWDKITMAVTMQSLALGKDEAILDWPSGFKQSTLNKRSTLSGSGSGVLFFDRTRGRVVRLQTSQQLKGVMTAEVGGQSTKVDIVEKRATTIQTLDSNPLDAKSLRQENEHLRKENERLRRRLRAVDEALRREDKPK